MRELKEACVVCGTNQKFIFEYQKHSYYRCRLCGLVSTYPLPDGATIESHYASEFKEGNYQLLRESMEQYIRVYNGFVQILSRKLQSYHLELRGQKVLDIGCFTGEFLGLLQDQGADVYGLELQSQAVEIADRKLPGRIFQADVFSSNFPQMRFDIVTLLGVIEHVIEPVRLLGRCAEFLNAGGVLLLQTPDSGSFLARVMRRLWPPFAPVEHIHLFTRSSVELALRDLGLKDISYKAHWKRLPIAYIYHMLQNFGPEFYRLLRPFYRLTPHFVANASVPFYIGEMIVMARKPKDGEK